MLTGEEHLIQLLNKFVTYDADGAGMVMRNKTI